MSFDLEFKARSIADAREILTEETLLPKPVADYILAGLMAYNPEQGVFIKAQGHLHDGTDFPITDVTIRVSKLDVAGTPEHLFRKTKRQAENDRQARLMAEANKQPTVDAASESKSDPAG